MSIGYVAIQWNRNKLIYDALLLGAVVAYIAAFIGISKTISPDLDLDGVQIRAYGSAALILMHVILSIGPLCRLNPSFLPLLFNRRHMGVTMFLLALIHVNGWKLPDGPWKLFGAATPKFPWNFHGAITWYHDFGNLDPLVSLFVGNRHYGDFIRFPFEVLGVIALVILFLMAATSHDFWLANLTAPIWKALHMGVYVAYACVVGHVVLGALQSNPHPVLAIGVGAGMVWILAIHLICGAREWRRDMESPPVHQDGFVEVGTFGEIPEGQAKVVMVGGERAAVYRHEGRIFALSNVCQHQNGPLGEGRIVDGCVTCPWHGYQYNPANGASPPPFQERVPTFTVRMEGDRILLRARPNPPLDEAVHGAMPT